LADELADGFKGHTVLLTGADGFFGSHIAERLVALGADLHVFVRASSSGQLNNIAHLLGKMTVHRGDLVDPASVRLALTAIARAREPYIIHLGAQAHVGYSWQRPYETIATNVIGTLNILQSVIDLRIKLGKMDIAGTSEEYGNPDPRQAKLHRYRNGHVIWNEASPINPESPYATSKVAADFLGRNYWKAYGLPAVTMRPFNTYGPRQSPQYVTGTIITQALSRPEVVLGNLETTRDFTYVADTVESHLLVTLKGQPGNGYVAGYGKDVSMGDWAQMIIDIGQSGRFWDGVKVRSDKTRFRPGSTDLMRLGVDYTNFKRDTGWEPRVSREEGVERTIRWYAENRHLWQGRVDWR
jgi:dTDP-glucose 4,6-dehydratase